MKRARELVSELEDAYTKLTNSAMAADIKDWKRGEKKAQDGRVKDVQSMDYFSLKMNQGLYLSIGYELCPMLRFVAPGKAEVQLELVNG
jgi:hypothetical protein